MSSQKKDIFIFFGPPGSGKGTVCQKIVDADISISHFSVGSLCRKYALEETDFGKSIKRLIDEGNLISFQDISFMIEEYLKSFLQDSSRQILLLDGFPRNKEQAVLLSQLYKRFSSYFSFYFLIFEIEQMLLVDRMINRRVCSNIDCERVYSALDNNFHIQCKCCSFNLIHRADDQREIIHKRISFFFDQEQDILNVFRDNNFVISSFKAEKKINDLLREVGHFFKQKNIHLSI